MPKGLRMPYGASQSSKRRGSDVTGAMGKGIIGGHLRHLQEQLKEMGKICDKAQARRSRIYIKY